MGKKAAAPSRSNERLIPEPTGIGVFEVEDGSGLWEIGGTSRAPRTRPRWPVGGGVQGQALCRVPIARNRLVAHVRRELAPVRAGRSLSMAVTMLTTDKVPDDVEPLLIEAAMAFGTGHHGTTLGCLRAVETLIERGVQAKSVADIGCGTAVLAMAAARVWHATILASDIDQVAVDVAQANLRANGIDSGVECVEAAGFDHPALHKHAPYDVIFANILKGPLVALSPEIAAHLQPGGFAILSGILNEQAAGVIAVYLENGTNLISHEEIGDWSTLILQKIA
ncbi:UNVERIFIED_CONTAM: hypothetical protein GTU68_034118 [Idotea baltica]|nr:hypothetical protein [Idotea baltica]